MARFEALEQKAKQLTEQKEELNRQIASARTRISAKEKQLADIEEISSQILPFIHDIFNALKSQVADGHPFLTDERQERIHRLETIMADPDVEISEKYRKIMEALLVEAEYGFTIETYQETITIDGQAMLVDISFGWAGSACFTRAWIANDAVSTIRLTGPGEISQKDTTWRSRPPSISLPSAGP